MASLVLGPGSVPVYVSEASDDAVIAGFDLTATFTSPLLQLPPELIELIALRVDSLDGLQSLSATCRSLRTILDPDHLQWFHLRSGLDQAKLWQHLIDHPRLARNVRCLVLDSRSTPRIPSNMCDAGLRRAGSDPSLAGDIEELLLTAIEQMANLQKLVYRLAPPLAANEFWSRVWRSCPNLQDVECADCRVTRGMPERPCIHNSSFCNLSGLQKLVWYSSYVPPDPASIITELGGLEAALVERCPDLEELRIQYINQSVQNAIYGGKLMADAYWPKLRVLELSRFHAGDEEAVANFFERHSQLEVLKLDQVDATSGRYVYLDNLSDEALPKLHTFWGGIDNAISVLRSPSRPIRRIGGIQFDTVMLSARRPAHWTSTPQGQCLLEGLAQAEHLEELDGEFALIVYDNLDLIRLFDACKRLRRLTLRCSVEGFVETYLPAFEPLQELEMLHFPIHQLRVLQRPPASGSLTLRYHGRSDTFVSLLKHKARLVASVCRKLRQIDFGASGGTAKVVRYPDSAEVSEIVLADRDGVDKVGAEYSLELTRTAAMG